MWTQEDDLLFLKYCADKRDRCYHMLAGDLSCRPDEILGLKVKDVVFKMSANRQYAEVLLNGKTGSRHLPLFNSIPYVKDWLDNHPSSGNPNSPLICSNDKRIVHKISSPAICKIYSRNKKMFEALSKDQSIPKQDREAITLLLNKPWNPYIQRHSALTEKSKILEHTLRQHAGWSARSDMPRKYVHYFGNESSESLLEAYRIMPKSVEIDKLRPIQCPNCGESCKIESRFCFKCRMVLSYDAYSETVDEKDQEKIAELNKKILELESSIDHRIKEMAEDHFYAIVADELVRRRPARKAAADRQAREKASKKKAKLT